MIIAVPAAPRPTPSLMPRPDHSLWVLVLAAGGARRFGAPKLLQRWGRATLLEHAIGIAAAVAGNRVVVVLGARATRHLARVPPGVTSIVRNARWREGLGTSIACGVTALPRSATRAVVLLADQPGVTPRHLLAVAERARRSPAGAAGTRQDGGGPGVPACFARRHFSALRALSGDRGAAALLASLGVPTLATTRTLGDADTPEALAALRARLRPR